MRIEIEETDLLVVFSNDSDAILLPFFPVTLIFIFFFPSVLYFIAIL